MRRTRAKLYSSSGASMAIALMFLLLCLMVGAVVLTAAASNVGRFSHERENQQDYLTVSSAARLLRDRLEGLTYVTGEERVADDGPDGGTAVNYLNSAPSADTLDGLVKNTAERVFMTGTNYVARRDDIEIPATRSLSITDAGSGLDGISATLSMDADYNITVAFYLTDSPDSYPLTLTIPSEVQDVTSTDVTYYDVTVTEDVEGVPTDVTYTYSVATTTRTVTVTWDGGVITKGG